MWRRGAAAATSAPIVVHARHTGLSQASLGDPTGSPPRRPWRAS